jgi:hypothetical protein
MLCVLCIILVKKKKTNTKRVEFDLIIDCKYVENLVWFKKSVNNVCLDEPSPYISSTKEILLMFKKVCKKKRIMTY